MNLKQVWGVFLRSILLRKYRSRQNSDRSYKTLNEDNIFEENSLMPDHLKPLPFYSGQLDKREQQIILDLYESLRKYDVNKEDLK